MKRLIVPLAILLLVGVAAYLFTPVARIALWIYIIGACVTLLFGLIATIRWHLGKFEPNSAIYISLIRAVAQKDSISSLQFYTSLVLNNFTEALIWPLEMIILIWRTGAVGIKALGTPSIRGSSHQGLYPLEFVRCLSLMGITALMFVLGAPPSMTAICWLYSTLWLAKHIISTADLATTLRQSIGNPYFRLVLIGAAHYVILIIAYTNSYVAALPLEQWGAVFRKTAVALVAPSSFIGTFTADNFQPWEVARTLSGIIFYLAIFRLLLRRDQFKRTDKDWISLSIKQSNLGHYETALNHLQKVSDISKNNLEARGRALMGMGNFEDAIHTLDQVNQLDLSAGGMSIPAEIRGAFHLASLSPNAQTILDYLRFWLNREPPADGVLSYMVGTYLFLDLMDLDEFKPVIAPYAGRYPTTMAVMNVNEGEFDPVFDLFDKEAPDPFTEVMQILLLAGVCATLIEISPEKMDTETEQEIIDSLKALSSLTDVLNDYETLISIDRATGVLSVARNIDFIRMPIMKFKELLVGSLPKAAMEHFLNASSHAESYLHRTISADLAKIREEIAADEELAESPAADPGSLKQIP